MSSHPIAETIEAHGCRVVLRRVAGSEASELFLHCQPLQAGADSGVQADAIYRALLGILEGEGASFGSVVSETLFLRNLRTNLEPVRAARGEVLRERAGGQHQSSVTEIEQPPVERGACLEVAVQAVLPGEVAVRVDTFEARPACGCAECGRLHGLRVEAFDEARFYAGGLCGQGKDAYAQTLAMFGVAEDLLRQAGMEFSDVVRTWIHLDAMDRDYGDLNRARREFFQARGLDPVPASTGIGGGPTSEEHELCLGIYAVKADHPPVRTVMTSPTLNEAMQYGADFVRGMRMVERNKIALHVSGTASIDEAGRTVHPGDLDAQVDRMLVNIAALLGGQGATFGDVVSAVTYLKHPEDAECLREKFREAGFEGFPNPVVGARICRPELLCETEALAVLPRGSGSG